MPVPTRLMVRADKAGWSAEIHPSFEHALLRWMQIPLKNRFGGLLSDAALPEPRPPGVWEYKHIGLLCITQQLQRRVHHRVRTKLSGANIDPAEEHPHIDTIIVFEEEIDERHTLDADEVLRWERGISRMAQGSGEPGDLRWARGRKPPHVERPPVETEDVVEAEWSEIPVSFPALPPPPAAHRDDALASAIAGFAPPDAGPWARSLLDALPASFADDASAAAWARTALNVLHTLALSGIPDDATEHEQEPPAHDEAPEAVEEASTGTGEVSPDPVPEPAPVEESVEVREPVPEPAEGPAADDVPTEADTPQAEPDPVPAPEPPEEDRKEPGQAKPRKPAARAAPDPSAPVRLTGLEQRVLGVLSTFQPMRKVDAARILDHGRGAVNRAIDGLVAKGAAQDVGESHYVRVKR